MNTKRVTLYRNGHMRIIVLRADEKAIVGRKFRWGGGKAWIVVSVEEAA